MAAIFIICYYISQFNDMLTICLRSDDELFHVTIYSWLLSGNVNMTERVVEVCCFDICTCTCIQLNLWTPLEQISCWNWNQKCPYTVGVLYLRVSLLERFHCT